LKNIWKTNHLFNSHIYEEVAYEIYNLNNKHQNIGLGMIGETSNHEEKEFFTLRKTKCSGISHSSFTGNEIKKVAVWWSWKFCYKMQFKLEQMLI
jgi:hypothetical protein